jgi:nucleoside phosphorylase
MFRKISHINIIFLFYFGLLSCSFANSNPLQRVLLVVAMEKEALPIISQFNLKEVRTTSKLPMKEYSGNYKTTELFLVTNGVDPINKVQNVGTQAATLATYIGIEHFHPNLVISVGTAGGVDANNAKINKIYISKKIYFFDRRMPFEKYHEYGLGNYTSISFPDVVGKLGLSLGIVCSGDSFDENKTDYQVILKNGCEVIDMEAAGVAWVSMLENTPMFAMKGVTNYIHGKEIYSQYQKNSPSMEIALAKELRAFLIY